MTPFPLCPLFVPANKLDWIKKAETSNADGLIIDLEDSVPPEEKSKTRESLIQYLSSEEVSKPFFIRTNPLTSQEGRKDCSSFSAKKKNFLGLMTPKIESLDELKDLPDTLKIILLVETPQAIENLDSLASDIRVSGIALGGADLSAELGSDMGWDSLLYSRSRIISYASINGVFSIDSPFMQIDDLKGLEEESKKAKSIGFTSKFAIHPNQVEVIRRNFLPTNQEIEEAKEIIKAFANSDGGAIVVNGKMVDEPVVKLMKKKLMLAGFNPDN